MVIVEAVISLRELNKADLDGPLKLKPQTYE